MKDEEIQKIASFFSQKDERGISNFQKAKENSKVIRRIDSTSKDKSFEEVQWSDDNSPYPLGVVVVNGKFIGLGIHIFNEDVYPLQSFEIYLRGCDLCGNLNLDGCNDMVFIDLYNNSISSVNLGKMNSLRILGLQNNQISEIDTTNLPMVQGIDIGKNKISDIDVSRNAKLVELYINDNNFIKIDTSKNEKLKYFYCHNNRIETLNTTHNPLLRHLIATGNPLTEILSLAPQRDRELPLYLFAKGRGYVGLKFNPIYNAQWKETGKWEQRYFAYPQLGSEFLGWYDGNDRCVSHDKEWVDEYGTSRIITAYFGN